MANWKPVTCVQSRSSASVTGPPVAGPPVAGAPCAGVEVGGASSADFLGGEAGSAAAAAAAAHAPLAPITARSTYDDVLSDMFPGEVRTFAPFGPLAAAPAPFCALREVHRDFGRGERREWLTPGVEEAILRQSLGAGWDALRGAPRPAFRMASGRSRLKALYEPYLIVSAAFRAVAERLDPAGVDFLPIDLAFADGSPAPGDWSLFDVTRTMQVIDLSRFSGALGHHFGALRLASRIFAFDMRNDIPDTAHFIRDPVLARVPLVSQKAIQAFAAAGVDQLDFAPVNTGVC